MLMLERNEIRKNLIQLKMHVDEMDDLTKKAMAMIYNLEDRMIDQDELDYAYKYGFLAGVEDAPS